MSRTRALPFVFTYCPTRGYPAHPEWSSVYQQCIPLHRTDACSRHRSGYHLEIKVSSTNPMAPRSPGSTNKVCFAVIVIHVKVLQAVFNWLLTTNLTQSCLSIVLRSAFNQEPLSRSQQVCDHVTQPWVIADQINREQLTSIPPEITTFSSQLSCNHFLVSIMNK